MIWVDDMLAPARLGRWPAKWSHLFASTTDELLAFAARLDLNAAWLQHPGTHREHFDIPMGKRDKAIQLGALAIRYPSGTADLLDARRSLCGCRRLSECRWAFLAAAEAEAPP